MISARSFLGILLLSASCSTNPGYSESENATTQKVQDSDPIVLRKRVGWENKELKDKQQHFDCAIRTSQVKEYPNIKDLLEKLAKAPLGVKYIFVPIIPSQEYFAYLDGKEQVIFKKGSAIEFRQPEKETQLENQEAKQLIEILDKQCRTP